ncbi:MAG: polysaccharide biosynthesis protein [Nitrososphaerota archaeon]|nr:polysaccharide biosynthesis protein [Nitrososphaerota archaeon]
MNRLRRSAVNMFSGAAGYALPMAVNLVVTPILLSILGEAAYGLQSLVSVIVGYMTFMDMGLDLPIIKLLAEDRAKQDPRSESELLNTTLQVYTLVGIVGMGGIMLLAGWLSTSVFRVPPKLLDEACLVFRLAGIGFLGSVGMSWGKALSMGLQRFDLSNSVSVIFSTVGTLSGLLFAYLGFGVVGYVASRVAFMVLAGPAYFFLSRQFLPNVKFHVGLDKRTLHRVKSYLGYGLINRTTSSLVSRLDQTLLGIWVGVAAAGVYAVPFLLVNSLIYMLSYTLGFVFPLASELQATGQMDKLREIVIKASRFMTAISGLIFAPAAVLGGAFLKIWTPSIAVKASVVLPLLAIAGYVSTVTTPISNGVLIGLGNMRQFTIYATVRAAALAVFCFIFIHSFGLVGAGIAVLLTGSVDIVYWLIVQIRYLKISPRLVFIESCTKPMLLTAGLAVLAFLARPLATSWFHIGTIGVVLFAFYVFGGLVMKQKTARAAARTVA